MSMRAYQLFRYQNPDGSSKDWAIWRDQGSYITRWGKTGSRLAGEKTKPVKHPDEVQKLIRSKLAKGYVFMGTAIIDDDGNLSQSASQGPVTLPSPPAPPEPEAIYWRFKVVGQPGEPSLSSFKAAIGQASQALELTYSEFDFGRFRNTLVALKDGAGKIWTENGVAPLLFLMAIKRAAPTWARITLSSEDGVEISEKIRNESGALEFFGETLESVRQVAEDLGLVEKRLDLSLIETDLPDFSF